MNFFSLELQPFARPLAPIPFAVSAIIVTAIGAIYCNSYAMLTGATARWTGAIGWSLVAVLPWFALFESIKHVEARQQKLLSRAMLACLLGATAILSLLSEQAVDRWIWNDIPAPVAISLLRRLPAIGIILLLILIARARIKKAGVKPAPLATLADHIYYISAADNYLELYFADHMVMRRQTLQSAESELVPLGFLRIHRSKLANVTHIDRVEMKGRGAVVLKNGTSLPVGSRYRKAVRHFVP